MTTATSPEHDTKVLDAALTAAWLKRCGPEGAGEWWIPGEFLAVTELHSIEVEVYPTYAKLDADGRPKMWGNLGSDGRVDGWEWHLNLSWDDLTESEIYRIEDEGGCAHEQGTSFHVLGSHQEVPPIPEGLVNTLAFLGEGPHYADEDGGREMTTPKETE